MIEKLYLRAVRDIEADSELFFSFKAGFENENVCNGYESEEFEQANEEEDPEEEEEIGNITNGDNFEEDEENENNNFK